MLSFAIVTNWERLSGGGYFNIKQNDVHLGSKKQAEESLDKELYVDDEIESSNSEEKRLPKKRTSGVNFSEVGNDDENDSDVIGMKYLAYFA